MWETDYPPSGLLNPNQAQFLSHGQRDTALLTTSISEIPVFNGLQAYGKPTTEAELLV
jgi:hypothetical protein